MSGLSPFLGDCYLSTNRRDVISAVWCRAPTSGVSFCWSAFHQSLCLESPTVLSGRSLCLEWKAAPPLWNVICYSVLQSQRTPIKTFWGSVRGRFAISAYLTTPSEHRYNYALASFPLSHSLVRCPERDQNSEQKLLIKIQSKPLLKGWIWPLGKAPPWE